jgi:hypothetical protein
LGCLAAELTVRVGLFVDVSVWLFFLRQFSALGKGEELTFSVDEDIFMARDLCF